MTTREIQGVEDIRSNLKEGEQRNIFNFIYEYSDLPNSDNVGIKKDLLHIQSFRDEKTLIRFKNGKSGYRIELNDRSNRVPHQPTVVFYFLEDGNTYFRLQEPTAEGNTVNQNGFDTIPGIPATNIHDQDMRTLKDALQIDQNVLLATTNPEIVKGKRLVLSVNKSPTRVITGYMTFALNRGHKNKVIHGKVRFFK